MADGIAATGAAQVPAQGASAGPVGGPGYATAGDVLGDYLRGRATAFLRALGPGAGSGPASAPGPFADGHGEAGAVLRGSARRIAGVLHVYAPLTAASWAEPLRTELGWLAGTLSREAEYPARLARLLEALRRLSAGDAAGAGGGGYGEPAPAATGNCATSHGGAAHSNRPKKAPPGPVAPPQKPPLPPGGPPRPSRGPSRAHAAEPHIGHSLAP